MLVWWSTSCLTCNIPTNWKKDDQALSDVRVVMMGHNYNCHEEKKHDQSAFFSIHLFPDSDASSVDHKIITCLASWIMKQVTLNGKLSLTQQKNQPDFEGLTKGKLLSVNTKSTTALNNQKSGVESSMQVKHFQKKMSPKEVQLKTKNLHVQKERKTPFLDFRFLHQESQTH